MEKMVWRILTRDKQQQRRGWSSKLHSETRWMMSIYLTIAVMLSSLVTDRSGIIMAKEIDSKSDLLEEETMAIPAEHRAYPDMDLSDEFGAYINNNNKKNNMALSATNKHHMVVDPNQNELWPMVRPETSIKAINVKCEKNQMKVNIEFDKPFNGLIFSKGYYSDPKCVHLPAGSNRLQANFEIYLGSCGMASSEKTNNPASSLGMFIENTIIIQYDPQVQEIWDQARKLRCTWYDFYEKAVTFRPFNVDMLDAVTANFLGDNIQCWMQIQVGKGPWASEVAGIVKIGQTMTMVLAIKDEENKFDMLVRNCIAHDGKHTPIQLVDEFGCILRPKIMSKFQKVKNFGHSATVVSYAYFQAFKFPDSMNVHFQCVIQVCRHECPPANCEGDGPPQLEHDSRKFLNRIGDIPNPSQQYFDKNSQLLISTSHNQNQTKPKPSFTINSLGAMPRSLNLNKLKRKRSTDEQDELKTDINTEKVIKVVAPGDVAFALPLSGSDKFSNENENDVQINDASNENLICMPATGFIISLVLLIMLLLLTTLITIFLVIRLKNVSTTTTTTTKTKTSRDLSLEKCSKHYNTYCTCNNKMVPASSPAPYYVSMPSINLTNVS